MCPNLTAAAAQSQRQMKMKKSNTYNILRVPRLRCHPLTVCGFFKGMTRCDVSGNVISTSATRSICLVYQEYLICCVNSEPVSVLRNLNLYTRMLCET